MKKFMVALIFAVGLGLGVLAQNALTVQANASFTPVAFLGSKGKPLPDAPALQVATFEMSDGATCYALTPVDNAVLLENLSQLVSLGCVR